MCFVWAILSPSMQLFFYYFPHTYFQDTKLPDYKQLMKGSFEMIHARKNSLTIDVGSRTEYRLATITIWCMYVRYYGSLCMYNIVHTIPSHAAFCMHGPVGSRSSLRKPRPFFRPLFRVRVCPVSKEPFIHCLHRKCVSFFINYFTS